MYRYVGQGESLAGFEPREYGDEEFKAAIEAYALGWAEDDRAEVKAAVLRRCQPATEEEPQAQLFKHVADTEPPAPLRGRRVEPTEPASEDPPAPE